MARTPDLVIVDPDVISRAETARTAQLADVTVRGEAGYGIEAVAVAKEQSPDIFLIAVEEPVVRALQTIESLADACPNAPAIVYSSMKDAASVRRAMVAGARDYIAKPVDAQELLRAIHGVLEQEERRRMRLSGHTSEVPARGTVITVFGAKGGIGKTTLSTNLASALFRTTNSSVVLVDMDTRFGDVAIMMDLVVEQSIADLARNIDSMDREKIRDYLVEHPSGVFVLPAPLHPSEWKDMTPHHIEMIIDLLAQTHDYVVIDTPGTFNEIVATALEQASIILLVTSMDIASIKDTALALEMLRAASVPEDKVKLTINRCTAANSLREQDIQKVLEYEVFARIPHDISVSSSTQLGQPIVLAKPYSRVSRTIMDLAYTLSGAHREQKGFLDRVLGRA